MRKVVVCSIIVLGLLLLLGGGIFIISEINYESYERTSDTVSISLSTSGDSLWDIYAAVGLHHADLFEDMPLVRVQGTTIPGGTEFDEIVFEFAKYIDDTREGGIIKSISLTIDVPSDSITRIDKQMGSGRAFSGSIRPIPNLAMTLDCTAGHILERVLKDAPEEFLFQDEFYNEITVFASSNVVVWDCYTRISGEDGSVLISRW